MQHHALDPGSISLTYVLYMQTTNSILMIRPAGFRSNEQTAVNNFFMGSLAMGDTEVDLRAQAEFDGFADLLRSKGITVLVFQDLPENDTPDAVFPNNWISFHDDGTVVLYPMFAENRRLERRLELLDDLEGQGFVIHNILDYTSAETDGLFLEGTGSLVLDRRAKLAYCALSPRADESLLIEFCEDMGYFPVPFTANQTVEGQRKAIYHTNVMMGIAEDFALVCLQCIDDRKERRLVASRLRETGHRILEISETQLHEFAGNVLQVQSRDGKPYLVMSSRAYRSLTSPQLAGILEHCDILHSPLDTIETLGGGSARCMMAEIFLPGH